MDEWGLGLAAFLVAILFVHEPGHWVGARLAGISTEGLAITRRGIGIRLSREPDTLAGGILFFAGGAIANLVIASAVFLSWVLLDLWHLPGGKFIVLVGLLSAAFPLIQIPAGVMCWLIKGDRCSMDVGRLLVLAQELRERTP